MFLTKNVFKPLICLFVDAVICKKQVGNCVIRFYILYKSGFDDLGDLLAGGRAGYPQE